MAGGIKAWEAKTAIGTQDLGMDLFNGREKPLEVLKIAYSLEQGLRDFYLAMEKEAKNEKVKDLFARLSDIEVKHQMSIYLAYNDLSAEEVDKDTFEKMIETQALEGGLTTDEYLELFKPDMNAPIDVISLAMSIEAQALDLYQRVSLKIENIHSRAVINKIADEEKIHIAALGKLLEHL